MSPDTDRSAILRWRTTPQASDDDLVVAVGNGDRAALAMLFQRHYARVHSICYRMIGDAATAEDLAQESFVRVLKHAAGFERRAAFTTWLYRLVRNVCLNHIDAEMRRQAREQRTMTELETIRPAVPDDATIEEDERIATLRKALYSLSPEYREVLVLSRYQGHSYAEIAELCDTTVGAIKVRAHRAMRQLRSRYEDLERAT
jgi:RNA polymerase sigma factor (sigma-70 family)